MNAFSANIVSNSSFIGAFYLYWDTINAYLKDTIDNFRDSSNSSFLSLFDGVPESFYFDEFQITLLKSLLAVLFITQVFIFVAWRIYGKRICDRFMKPATSKAIEELKASVSKLKLPKEHTPRI